MAKLRVVPNQFWRAQPILRLDMCFSLPIYFICLDFFWLWIRFLMGSSFGKVSVLRLRNISKDVLDLDFGPNLVAIITAKSGFMVAKVSVISRSSRVYNPIHSTKFKLESLFCEGDERLCQGEGIYIALKKARNLYFTSRILGSQEADTDWVWIKKRSGWVLTSFKKAE